MPDIRILLAALLIVPTAAAADQRQFGNVIYTPLTGWNQGLNENGKITFLSDLPDDLCEFCYVNLSASHPGTGSAATFLKRTNLLFVDKDDQASVTLMGEPNVFNLNGHDAAMQGIKVGSNMQVVVAVSLGDRFEVFGFQGNAYDEEDLAESMSVFQTQVVPFFEEFTFVSTGVAPLLPAPQAGDIDGVWWGWSTYTTFGMDMMMRQEMDYRTLFFWPDGYFYDGTPPEGLTPIKPDALQAQADTHFGVYQQAGGSLKLTYTTGETESLTAEGTGWLDGSKTLTKVRPLADGEALRGSISSFFYAGFTPGSGLEGGISSSSSTEFFPDGTYKGASFGGASANFEAGGGFTTGNEGATGGTYIVKDGMVISTPSDGSAQTAALALRLEDDNILIGDQFLDAGK